MKFKECVNVKVREAAFAHLINRKYTRNSKKAKGKNVNQEGKALFHTYLHMKICLKGT